MDHFHISQECIHCLRGTRLFRVDLSCYDDNGKLIHESIDVERFSFICQFCWRNTRLDFYRFSHPDLMCYLKRIYNRYQELKNTVDRLNMLLNNI